MLILTFHSQEYLWGRYYYHQHFMDEAQRHEGTCPMSSLIKSESRLKPRSAGYPKPSPQPSCACVYHQDKIYSANVCARNGTFAFSNELKSISVFHFPELVSTGTLLAVKGWLMNGGRGACLNQVLRKPRTSESGTHKAAHQGLSSHCLSQGSLFPQHKESCEHRIPYFGGWNHEA